MPEPTKKSETFNTARLELTGTCDIKCLYCHAGEKNVASYRDGELSFSRWLELIAECKNLGVTTFILTGGEPFLYPKWPEIIEACGNDVNVVISTNGRHFTRENLAILANLPQVTEFRTSLDGLSTNDIIRDGSNHKTALESLEIVRGKLPDKKVMLQTVVYRQNLCEILPLYEHVKKLGIYRWRLSQLWKTIRTEKNRNIIDFSEYDLMFSIYAELIIKLQNDRKPFLLSIDNVYYSWIDTESYSPMALDEHPCHYNFDFLCINANGDLVFCPALNLPYASVCQNSLEEARRNSKWLRDFKNISVAELGCGNCRYIKICGGGCRADSKRWLDRVKTIDPNSCCMMPRIEENILPLLNDDEKQAFFALIKEAGEFPSISGKNIEEAISVSRFQQ